LVELFLTHKLNVGRAPKTIDRYRAGLDAFGHYLKKQKIEFAYQISLTTLDGYYGYRMKVEKRKMHTAFGDSIAIKGLFKSACRRSRGLLPGNPALDWETPEPVVPKRHCYTRAEVEALEALHKLIRPASKKATGAQKSGFFSSLLGRFFSPW
jgi:site-specific recombinase XerD